MRATRLRLSVVVALSIAIGSSASAGDVECIQLFFGGCLTMEGPAELHAADALQRSLIADALADPAALSDASWAQLVQLVSSQPDRRTTLRELHRTTHWQEAPPVESLTENPRVWAERWRDARPHSRAAWCAWVEQVDDETALRALRRALDDDPTNAGARRCLVRRLATLGELDAVREILAEHPIEVETDTLFFRAPNLPEDLRSLYALYVDLGDPDGQLDVVRRAFERRPHDAALDAYLAVFGEEYDEERLAELADAELPLDLHLAVCDELAEDDACLDRLVERTVELDVHRDPDTGIGAVNLLRLRGEMVERAVRDDDPAWLDEVLFEGPDVGRFHLWSEAVGHIADRDQDDEEADEPARRRVTREALCRRFDAAVLGDEIDTALDSAATCPSRVQMVIEALYACRDRDLDPADAVVRHLFTRLAARFAEWSIDHLLAWYEPRDLLIVELERRLDIEPDLRLLDRLAELTRGADVDPARALAARERLLELEPSEGARCRWLDAFVAADPGPRSDVMARALDRFPGWHDLRLEVLAEATDRARAEALAEVLLADPAASVRQKAEARLHLGRLARRTGSLADATDHLEHYYLTRLATVGCPPHRPECDGLLLGHLAELRDRERAARYLRSRASIAANHPDLAIGEESGVRRLRRLLDAGCGLDRPWSDDACSAPLPTGRDSEVYLVAMCQ